MLIIYHSGRVIKLLLSCFLISLFLRGGDSLEVASFLEVVTGDPLEVVTVPARKPTQILMQPFEP